MARVGDTPWVVKDADYDMTFEEWCGDRPKKGDYMPTWPEEERTPSANV